MRVALLRTQVTCSKLRYVLTITEKQSVVVLGELNAIRTWSCFALELFEVGYIRRKPPLSFAAHKWHKLDPHELLALQGLDRRR